ncbi:alpha-tocopherol transfer protein-like isoform X2 [Dermacentor andersoni]|uniref:alpha-tocopherol transfer protein-like isoform X2 n=1 Tax=Dermacentor andersoni TaxID=34620 RepID=UPI0024168CA1|nr:alpha-tocopherol transfer protein-like isoform X2 [Dermacentor andersoni]
MAKVSKIRSQQLNTAVTKTKAALNIEEVARLEVGETPEIKADSLLRLRQLLEGAWNPDICSLLDYTRAGILLSGSWLLEDVPSICGIECVLDMKGLNIHHLTQLTPSYLMKLANITQDCCPVRIKAVYIVNYPKIFEVLFAAIKPFLRSKLLSRVHFVGGEASEFWGRFPGDLVPAEFGGRREQFDYDRQEKFVHSSSAFFESLCTCGYRKNKT